MTLSELIEIAAASVGNQLDLAKEIGKHPSRISEWKKGKHKPEAGEIVRLAEIARLPVLQTLAEIESQLDEKNSQVWRNALGKLTAAGVAASVVGALAFAPNDANSRELHTSSHQIAADANHVYYVN
jgi:hypothetical protein